MVMVVVAMISATGFCILLMFVPLICSSNIGMAQAHTNIATGTN